MLDKLMINKNHKTKARIIYNKIFPLLKARPVVLIGGESGSGKSEVARTLQSMLHVSQRRFKYVAMDTFYATHWKNRDEIRQLTNVIGVKEIDWHSLKEAVRLFRGLASYDGIILEGLYACSSQCFYPKYSVYLEGDNAQTEEFRKKRGKEDSGDVFRHRVLLAERRACIKNKNSADLVIGWEEL